jgi:hypothetical protein
MEILTEIISAFGLSASAGLNAYIPLLTVSLLARYTNLIHLNSPWDTLANPWVIGLLSVLTIIEAFADKVPAINHINDAIQTFIRPAAGAIVFAASAKVLSDVHPVLAMIAGILVAGSVHAVKSVVVRPTVTATTAGFGNTAVSMLEDGISTVVSLLAVIVPATLVIGALLIFGWAVFRLLRGADRPSTV